MTTMPDDDLRLMVRRNAANWQPEWAASAAVGAITAWADDAPEFTERQRLLAIQELLAVYRGVTEIETPDINQLERDQIAGDERRAGR